AVTIVSPPPRAEFNVGRCLDKASRLGRDITSCSFPVSSEYQNLSVLLSNLVLSNSDKLESGTVKVVDLIPTVCPEDGICLPFENNTILYRDNGHFTINGSKYLGEKYNWYDMFFKE
ncbi:hypothetical protein NOG12_09550, partial [Pseudidiomarina sp. GXY010]